MVRSRSAEDDRAAGISGRDATEPVVGITIVKVGWVGTADIRVPQDLFSIFEKAPFARDFFGKCFNFSRLTVVDKLFSPRLT